MRRLTGNQIRYALVAAITAAGAALGVLHAEHVHVPVLVDALAAALPVLLAGQHLPTPDRGPQDQ